MKIEIKKININLKIITYAFIILVLSGGLVLKQGVSITWQIYYLLDLLYIVCIIITLCIKKRWIYFSGNKLIQLIPVIMIFTWGYGVILGIKMGNNRSYIIRNNAGMVMYILFYFLINADIKKINISKLLERLSELIVLINLLGFVIINFAPQNIITLYMRIPVLNCLQIGGVLGGFQPVLHYGRELIYICYGCALWDVLKTGKIFSRSMIKVLIVVFLSIVGMRSGGAQLAVLMSTAIIALSFFRNYINKNFLLIINAAVAVVLIYLLLGGTVPLASIFSKEDIGNSVRYEQISYFMKHMAYLGNGFGADLSEIGRTYVMEISYIDLFYKVGIFSIPVFLCYIITFYYGFKYLRKNNSRYATIPLTCMSYVYSALGNSVLFTSSSVLLHIIALYYLNGTFKEEVENDRKKRYGSFKNVFKKRTYISA